MKDWLRAAALTLAALTLIVALLALQALRDREVWEWCCWGW